jgi:uncharacterized membrane protein
MALSLGLALLSFALLLVELRRRERGGLAITLTGLLALTALLAAVFRPVRVTSRDTVVGARVVVLVDTSRSMALAADGTSTRVEVRDRALAALGQHGKETRLVFLGFGEGEAVPFVQGAEARASRSDLTGALRALSVSAEERPAAVVVVSDGRLDDPPEGASEASLRSLGNGMRLPVHTVAVAKAAPKDASLRRVAAAGAAVAHVPLPLRIDVGCVGLDCGDMVVTARELREDGPAELASGIAHIKDGRGAIDLTVTLERAGSRLLEVSLDAPAGDTIPENNKRLIAFNVARERVRVLHVAGRPTNDTRALRQWLKGDASVDVVAFFILRTPADNPNAATDDLALIPFPVDELFTDHLPSFDAVVLQDFDAQPYGLERHLPALARYVRSGGGLIMVGGPNSFVAGGYAGTPLADVLPITLDRSSSATAADLASFVPVWTEAGKGAPLLGPLRGVVGDELPSMPGANVLGDVRPGGLVLWAHPTRVTATGAKMPVLAVGDEGDGRAIALGVDGGWLFRFSQLGARTAGRGHGALWDGLLGWLMRDPRFEPAQMELTGGCVAGLASVLRVRIAPGGESTEMLAIELRRLDAQGQMGRFEVPRPASGQVDIPLGTLAAGGYSVRLKAGRGPTTRRDFACEVGGDEWADSRPDAERLEALAGALGGRYVEAGDIGSLPMPRPTVVSAERHSLPVAPPWVWTLAAAVVLGVHWFVRRRGGLR